MIDGSFMAITPPVVADRVIWLGMVEAALKGGVEILQLRLKPATPMEMMLQARRVLTLTRRYGIPLIINDFPEVAAEVGADGVHLGREDPQIGEVRKRYGKELIIGASAYCDPSRAMDLQQEGADYLGFSTPYVSKTKPDAPDCALDKARQVIAGVRIPVFMVGGITLDRMGELKSIGAQGFAVSWGLFGQGDPETRARAFARSWKEG